MSSAFGVRQRDDDAYGGRPPASVGTAVAWVTPPNDGSRPAALAAGKALRARVPRQAHGVWRASKVSLSLSVTLFDAFGQRWFGLRKEKTASSARDSYSAVTSSFADLNDQAVAAMFQQIRDATTDESGVSNFFRYALPMANGERRAFVSLLPGANGARVAYLPSFSVAADAGLQLGDTVTTLNGIQLAGKGQDELLTILRAAAKSGAADFEIIGGDGQRQHIKFEPKGLRWYLEHRPATGSF
jgi:hypothetical protein